MTIHIIGAGLSGLACAVRLCGQGRNVSLYEAAGHAGGRCRSFYDKTLGRSVDNGNHLLLSGNRSAMAYLDEIGARDTLISPDHAAFPFLDLDSDERWTVRPNAGPLPWWILCPGRRVPGARLRDYLAALRLRRAGCHQTVTDILDPESPLFERFWEPLVVAVLNAPVEAAAANLLWPVLMETFAKGERACRPRIARAGLSQSFVDPAICFLERHGAAIHYSHRLKELEISDGRVNALQFNQWRVELGPADPVIMALPPAAAAGALPGLDAPGKSSPIVGAHFRLDHAPQLPGGSAFLGLVGSAAHWLFVRDDIASITISSADDLVDAPAETIAAKTWCDVSRALDLTDRPMPPFRVIKERRATFTQIPSELKKRRGTVTDIANLFLAGDWTDTGLPATIEGAIRSGHSAAAAAQ
ncbi:MAG: hydroxysqualene dehydroxylase HpnE [Sphingomonadales bacterium]